MNDSTRRGVGFIAIACGVYVVLTELPFLASRSSLAPPLVALAVGMVLLGFIAASSQSR